MERWIYRKAKHGEDPRVDAFLADIIKVCVQHQMTLGHEDSHGAFIVHSFDQHNLEWIGDAMMDLDEED